MQGVDGSTIRCIDNSGTITFENVVMILDDDFTFSVGHFDIFKDFDVVGDGLQFNYQSTQQSTIQSNARFILEQGLTFSYDPMSSNRDLLNFVDRQRK